MAEVLHKDLSYKIIGAAMEVHRTLGPGFLESVYQRALMMEFGLKDIPCEEQKPVLVWYKESCIGEFVADFLVDGKVIVEIKAVSKLNSVHEVQAHHYLAATGFDLALLINFGAESLEYKRIIRKGYISS